MGLWYYILLHEINNIHSFIAKQTFIFFDSSRVFIKPLVRLFISSYFVILMSFEALVKL